MIYFLISRSKLPSLALFTFFTTTTNQNKHLKMSFLIKNSEYRFLVSISSLDEEEVIVLATDLHKYYVEKAVSYALIDDRLNVN